MERKQVADIKVTVIGGGAAGMMAALTAAEQGHQVTLLERQNRVGKKLLATGNGRCNLTNLNLSAQCYHGAPSAFIAPALETFGTADTLEFFHSLGLLTVAEDSGRVYPLSDQAGSVVDVLRFALEAAGVNLRTEFDVTSVKPTKTGFKVCSPSESVLSDKLIICCGGLAGTKLGGTKSGYELLRSMGHRVSKLYPVLVQLKTDNTWVRSLKGVRADAAVTLMGDGEVLAESAGEVQFADYGVSGPAIFEISRAACSEKGPLTVRLDLLRNMDFSQVEEVIAQRCRSMPALTLENLLTGVVHNRLGRTVLRYAGYDLNAPVSSLKPGDMKKIAAALGSFTLPVTGNLGFDGAQVTAGGILTDDFNPQTMESRLVPGLYAAGEVLDVDGDCGGYNLQWAWANGRLAGQCL